MENIISQEILRPAFTMTPLEVASCAVDAMKAMQKIPELTALLEIVSSGQPEVVVEIGVGKGGTAWAWSKIPSVKKLVLIDLPDGPWGGGPEDEVIKYISECTQAEVVFIKGNSQHPKAISELARVLGNDKIDFLMIDGDHSALGVAADYELYKDFVKKDGLIAFHDVCVHPEETKCEVHVFWDKLKNGVPEDMRAELISEPTNWGGIGILKHATAGTYDS